MTPLKVLLIMTLLLAAASCRRGGDAARGVQTQTIAPAAAKPAPNGSDAMTQTVDIEDSRSEAEGGVMTTPRAATAKAAAKKAPVPARKRK